MPKLLSVLVVILGSSLLSSCLAGTVYTVGESAGWDISTDLDSWAQTKTFVVGDSLSFLYSQSHSVSKVTKENYVGCNTTNVLQSSSTGNTTFLLTNPGDAYFICGNKLHCLGGMKLHVYADENAASPAPSPQQAAGGVLPPPGASKNDNPSSIPSSAMSNNGITVLYMMLLSFYFVLYLV